MLESDAHHAPNLPQKNLVRTQRARGAPREQLTVAAVANKTGGALIMYMASDLRLWLFASFVSTAIASAPRPHSSKT